MTNIYSFSAFGLSILALLCFLFVLIFTIKVLYELIVISIGSWIEKRK